MTERQDRTERAEADSTGSGSRGSDPPGDHADRRRGGIRGAVARARERGAVPVFLAVTAGWFLSLGGRLVFPALLPQVRGDLGFDLTVAGTLLTVLWTMYALSQFPGGVLGDRYGERAILLASTVVAGVGLVVVGTATGVAVFGVGLVVFGTGAGLYSTTRMTVISDVFPEDAATAMSISQAAGNLGTVALPAAAGAVALVAGWRVGFGGLLPLFVLTTVGLLLAVPRRTSPAADGVEDLSRETVRGLVGAIGRPGPLSMLLTMLAMSFVYQSFTGFYPTYLVSVKSLSEGTASLLFGVFFGTGVVVQPVAGVVADRLGARLVMTSSIGVTVAGLLALPFVDGLPGLLPLTAVIGVQLGFWPVANSVTIDLLPAELQGSGFGLLRSTYLLLAATGPLLVGVAAEATSFDLALLCLDGLGLVGLVLVSQLPRTDRHSGER